MPTILGLEGSANKVAVGIVRDGEVRKIMLNLVELAFDPRWKDHLMPHVPSALLQHCNLTLPS